MEKSDDRLDYDFNVRNFVMRTCLERKSTIKRKKSINAKPKTDKEDEVQGTFRSDAGLLNSVTKSQSQVTA